MTAPDPTVDSPPPVGAQPAALAIPYRRLHPDAAAPAVAHPGDAGADLRAVTRLELGPGERGVVATGVAVAIPDGWAGLVLPRSGLARRHGITLVNTPGLIDSGYRGEVQVLVLNTDRSESFTIEPGDRIAQLMLVPFATPNFVAVDELGATARGEGGFGSSGRA